MNYPTVHKMQISLSIFFPFLTFEYFTLFFISFFILINIISHLFLHYAVAVIKQISQCGINKSILFYFSVGGMGGWGDIRRRERARRSGGTHPGSRGVALHVKVCLHAENRKSAAK